MTASKTSTQNDAGSPQTQRWRRVPIRRYTATSQGGSARRPLTLRDGHGLDLMAASGQIPVAARTSSWLWIVIPVVFALVGGLDVCFGRSGPLHPVHLVRIRQPDAQGIGESAADPLGVAREEVRTGGRTGDKSSGAAGVHLVYTTDVVEVGEHHLYSPAGRLLKRVVRVAERLQSGRLDAYMAYMLIALIAVLAIVAGMA